MALTGEFDHMIRLLLLGDSAVGKSSLLRRFCDNEFHANFVITIGVDFKCKEVQHNGQRLRLQVWDTAGQERFRTITPAYYRAAMGVVIVYDVTDHGTFDQIEYWLRQLDQHADLAIQRILVGNKSDLDSRKVTTEAGQALAERFGMAFFETSAKTGEGVEEAFLHMTDLIVAQRYPAASGGLVLTPEKKKKPCTCSR